MNIGMLYPEASLFEWMWNYIVSNGSFVYGVNEHWAKFMVHNHKYDYAYGFWPVQNTDLEAHFYAERDAEKQHRIIEMNQEPEVDSDRVDHWEWPENQPVSHEFYRVGLLMLSHYLNEALNAMVLVK